MTDEAAVTEEQPETENETEAAADTEPKLGQRGRPFDRKAPYMMGLLGGFGLLTAYAAQRQQRVLASVHLAKRTVWSLAEARASLERLVGMAEDWSCLDEYLLSYVVDPTQKATVFASSFAAALELVREGEMELHQQEAFAPLYFRKRPPQTVSDAMTAPDLSAE